MKRIICLILLVAQLAPEVTEAATLQFAASVQDEELAEESIFLLHCLAERTGSNWEFNGTATGAHWLKVDEAGPLLKGSYRHGEKQQGFTMKAGESEAICEKLEPSEKEFLLTKRNPEPAFPAPAIKELPKKNYWPWLAAVGAVAAAGLIVWKSRQPSYRSVQMN